MKIHELTWSRLCPHLEVYEQLDPGDRTALRAMQGAQSVEDDTFGDGLTPLLEVGLLRRLKRAPRVVLTTEARPFLLGLRVAERCEVLHYGSLAAVTAYILESHPQRLRAEILREEPQSYYGTAQTMAERVGTMDWVNSTLAADRCGAWKRSHARSENQTEHVYTPAIRDLMERLVAALVSADEPVAVQDLAGLLETSRIGDIDRLFQAALRYLVVFPGIDPETGAFVIGLHPTVHTRLGTQTVPPPELVDVELTTFPGLLMPDLHQALVAVGGGHIRVKTDGALFKKDSERLAESLSPPPAVPGPWQYKEPVDRLVLTVSRGIKLGLMQVGPDTGGRKRLVVTEAGRAWIAMPAHGRLQAVLEHMGPFAKPPVAEEDFEDAWYGSDAGPSWEGVFSGFYGILSYGASRIPLRDACLDLLRSLPEQGGVSQTGFLLHAARKQNPLLGQGPYADQLDLDHDDRSRFGTEARENLWGHVMGEAIQVHLMPWGGLNVGMLGEARNQEEEVLIGLNPMGAWLLGLADAPPTSIDLPAHVVVQPTFEVMFFEPDLQGAAELAPFCDRIGETVGVVFRISKESISRAAAAGIPKEVIFETLDRLSRTPVPGNVRKEIETWHGRQRVVMLKQPWILDCGDAETADRVLAAARSKLERLSDSLLALKGRTKPETVAKLLAAHGVTLDTSQVPQPKKRAKRRRARRRYW